MPQSPPMFGTGFIPTIPEIEAALAAKAYSRGELAGIKVIVDEALGLTPFTASLPQAADKNTGLSVGDIVELGPNASPQMIRGIRGVVQEVGRTTSRVKFDPTADEIARIKRRSTGNGSRWTFRYPIRCKNVVLVKIS